MVYADTTIADQQYWEEHWGTLSLDTFQQAQQGKLLRGLEYPLIKYLPKTGKILEAGCGTGHVVLALRTRGYNVEGVEWATNVVDQVKRILPTLPIRAGDVTNLDVSDQTYSAVISLGVAEHRYDGPMPFITEAYRILQPGGLFFISVPYFHVLRRLRYCRYKPKFTNSVFYQYAFLPREFKKYLASYGFDVLDQFGYEFWFSLCEDFSFVKFFERIPLIGPHLEGVLNRSLFLSNLSGHMILFVAQRQ